MLRACLTTIAVENSPSHQQRHHVKAVVRAYRRLLGDNFQESGLPSIEPRIAARRAIRTGGRNGISTLNYLDWQNQNSVFEYMTPFAGGVATLTGTSEPVQLRRGQVAPEYFQIFGVHAVLGRTLAAGEDQPGKNHVVVLSHVLWETQFGGDPTLIGKTIRLDGELYTVVGVLPAGGSFDRLAAQSYTPLVFQPENMTRNFHWFASFAKLKPAVTLAAARQGMDVIGARIAQDYPDSNKGWGVAIERYADILGRTRLEAVLVHLMAGQRVAEWRVCPARGHSDLPCPAKMFTPL